MDIRQQGIIRFEPGIIEKEGIYFHTASAFAQQHLFYGLWGARYLCSAPYSVRRKHLNAFLMFYIHSGEMQFTYRDQTFTASADDIVLIDCNFPHNYYTKREAQFSWFHFHGNASQAYCDLLWKNNGALFSKQYGLEKDFQKIMQMLPLDANADDRMSVVIHHILSSLNTQGHAAHNVSPQIQAAKNWMDEHFHENIQIEEVAAQVSLSRFYFSRRFREETGLSPHEYLLNLRLSYAKLQLSESDDSIEEIAYDCAFCSASNLIRAFKKSTGLTPYQFRKTVFITTH